MDNSRRSPFAFLRALFSSSQPADSFVPALPHLDHPTTPTKSFFHRVFRKSPPPSDAQHSFFDVLSPVSRLTDSGRTAYSTSRLSSAFARTSPDLSSVVPTSCSIAEQRDALRSGSQTDLPSKASPRFRLRTKLSLTKLVSPNSHPSSSTDTSLAPSSFSYHPYSTNNPPTHPYASQLPQDRSFSPEDDPFRKDEATPAFSRSPDSSPKSASIRTHIESQKHLMGSRSLPVLPSGLSSDLDTLSPSAHVLSESGGSHSSSGQSRTPLPPSQRPMSPLSLTFPLPPSPHGALSVPVLTVQVTTPAPGPPPAYPPPLSPPPLEPLPFPPPVGVDNASPPEASQKGGSSERRSGRDSSEPVQKLTPAGQARRRHSHSRADRSPSSFMNQYRLASSRVEDRDFQRIPGKRTFRRKDRPLTPFPLPLVDGQVMHDPTGRLQALKAAPSFMSSQTDPATAIDQTAEAMPDSEVEPDLDFTSSKARKKISVSSAKSAQSAISSVSTASESTTTSSTSIATTSTAATTVSPSINTHTSVDKTRDGSQVPIADEDGTTVSAQMYSTLSPPDSSSPEISAGIYLKQGGTIVHERPNDLLLAGGEQVIIGASGWAEFRDFCDTHCDISLRLAGSTRGDGVADILVFEVQHFGKVRGVELLLYPRHRNPYKNADFTCRIPGSYPLSLDLSSSLPIIPRISPIDIPQSAWNEWIENAQALDGTLVLCGPQTVPDEPNPVHDGETCRTLLAFVAIFPTTLRDLVMRAGECLLDGVATSLDGPHLFKETIVNP